MTLIKEIWLVFLLGFIGLNIFLLFPGEVGLLGEERSRTSIQRPQKELEQMAQSVHLVETQGEALDWELWAERAERPRADQLWQLTGVSSRFYGQEGVIYSVKGDRGIVSEDQKQVEILGKVETRSTNGYQFETEKIFFESETRVLQSPGPIRMQGPRDMKGYRMVIEGVGLGADLKTNLITVNSKVSARKMMEDGRWVNISSDRAEMDGSARTVRFLKNVAIRMDTLKVSGPRAVFTFKRDQDEIETLDVTGGVRITDVDKWATSDRLRINLEKESVVLEGKPRVVQNEEELRGERIMLLENGKKVRVLKGKAKLDPDRTEE